MQWDAKARLAGGRRAKYKESKWALLAKAGLRRAAAHVHKVKVFGLYSSPSMKLCPFWWVHVAGTYTSTSSVSAAVIPILVAWHVYVPESPA